MGYVNVCIEITMISKRISDDMISMSVWLKIIVTMMFFSFFMVELSVPLSFFWGGGRVSSVFFIVLLVSQSYT